MNANLEIGYFLVFLFLAAEQPSLLTLWLIPGLIVLALFAADHYWLHPRKH